MVGKMDLFMKRHAIQQLAVFLCKRMQRKAHRVDRYAFDLCRSPDQQVLEQVDGVLNRRGHLLSQSLLRRWIEILVADEVEVELHGGEVVPEIMRDDGKEPVFHLVELCELFFLYAYLMVLYFQVGQALLQGFIDAPVL